MSNTQGLYQSTINRTRDNNRLRSHTPSNYHHHDARESKSMVKPIHSNDVPAISNSYINNARYYYLGRGNNHQLIRRILQIRGNWVETQPSNGEYIHFKWVQNSYGFKFHTLGKEVQCINHFEYHKQISNKQRLHQNMLNFCQANKMNVYNYLPVTFVIDLNTGEEDLALHSFLKFYNRNTPSKYSGVRVNSIILPRNKYKYQPYLSAQQLNKRSQGNFYCKPHCTKMMFSKTNDLQQTEELKKKNSEGVSYLWILKPSFLNRGRGIAVFNDLVEFQKLIWKYYEGEGLEDYEDKVIEEKGEKQEYQAKQHIQCIIDQDKDNPLELNRNSEDLDIRILPQNIEIPPKNIDTANNQDILKQIETSNSTQKQLSSTMTNLQKSHLEENRQKNYLPNINENTHNAQHKPRCLSFVVQKYIERPMLLNNYKFDIRVWALVNQDLEVYFFREGYLRLSSKPYSTSSNTHHDPFIHLTNNSVQKYSSEYDNESGNQYSLHQLLKHLPNQTYYIKILEKIKEIIWLSFCSVRRKININSRKECFQLFGYDFMVDESYKVWLIQVNTNPAIQQASPLLKVLLPRMIDDMFKLTIDKIFGKPKNNTHLNSQKGKLESVVEEMEQFPVPGYNHDENIFELLGDLREGTNEKNYGKRLTFVRR